MLEDSRDAGNGEVCRELSVISVIEGSGTVVRYNGLARDGRNERRGRVIVGLQKLLENNRKRGMGGTI